MKAKDLLRILKKLGCVKVRQKGSHLVIRCGECQTVVPVHKGEDIPTGTLASIVRDLTPCLGKDWLKKN